VEDFEVTQDGEPKQITNFKLYTDEIIRQEFVETTPGLQVPEPTPVPDPTDAAGPIPVHFVIYIDNQNLEPLDRNRVLSQARDFVKTSLHPPAKMMVVAYQRSFEVLQPFTDNPNEVLDAMRSVRRYTGGRSERNNVARELLDDIKRLDDANRSGGGGQGHGAGLQDIYRRIDLYAEETSNDLQFTLDSLRQIITSLSGLPGKKGVVYISNGLPMIPGMELYYELSRQANNSTALTQMFEHDRTRFYQQLAAIANSQDVTLYTVDASGLTLGNISSAEYTKSQDGLSASVGRHNLTDSLEFLADETGGIAIINTNDVSLKLELVRQDMFTYYSIGYPLQKSGGDKVHKVEIKLKDKPEFKGYNLRYRSRFVEKSLETQVQDTVVSSLVFEVDDNPMDVEFSVGTPSAASEKRWLVPARISFPLRNVALLPVGDDYVGRIVMFVAVRDSDGKQSDLVRQEHEVRVPASAYERAQERRWTIDTQLLTESGRYKMSVAILDPITRQDSYETISASVFPDK
jgi:VWFA-related protein